MDKTSTGLTENIAGLLCYVLGRISGLVFVLIERENKFVRFHALQSIVTFGGITIISIALSILGFIPFLGVVFSEVSNAIMYCHLLPALMCYSLWMLSIVFLLNKCVAPGGEKGCNCFL